MLNRSIRFITFHESKKRKIALLRPKILR